MELYKAHKNAVCLKCSHVGAIQFVGRLKEDGRISRAVGFGGTIPLECTNCGNTGLLGGGEIRPGLEGYETTFAEQHTCRICKQPGQASGSLFFCPSCGHDEVTGGD